MTLAIVILVSVLVGFGGGWGVKGWKDTAKISIIEKQKAAVDSRNSILESANSSCATDIEGVKKGMAIIVAGVEEREKAASDAMKAADLKIAQRKGRIVQAAPAIAPAPEAQCAAIMQEQAEYVKGRKDGN